MAMTNRDRVGKDYACARLNGKKHVPGYVMRIAVYSPHPRRGCAALDADQPNHC